MGRDQQEAFSYRSLDSSHLDCRRRHNDGRHRKLSGLIQSDLRRTVRKIVNLDDHIALACAGLKADARALINKKYTQSGGVRPFGLSTLIIGFDPYTGAPALYQTDPFGTFSAWKANATGRNSNSLREFLEKNYKETAGQETVKLAIRALLEGNQQRRESTSEAKTVIGLMVLVCHYCFDKAFDKFYDMYNATWKGYGL
ncbi:proteasome subunit alpha type-7-like [Humulus lupulus]|uniref:proteasome subunit alpha type-7-like n=1 Tax=Humulus lupulus TaxID=3486 RepID=UPI002B407154|nr:proteasome subunit alpha type-7-like [Humulus lupulus]